MILDSLSHSVLSLMTLSSLLFVAVLVEADNNAGERIKGSREWQRTTRSKAAGSGSETERRGSGSAPQG